jgi:hypothetical protein
MINAKNMGEKYGRYLSRKAMISKVSPSTSFINCLLTSIVPSAINPPSIGGNVLCV